MYLSLLSQKYHFNWSTPQKGHGNFFTPPKTDQNTNKKGIVFQKPLFFTTKKF